jgi:hypothetical protein
VAHLQRHNQDSASSEGAAAWSPPLHLALRHAAAECALRPPSVADVDVATARAECIEGSADGMAMVELLLSHRADPRRRDHRGHTAVDVARELGAAFALRRLLDASTAFDATPVPPRGALVACAEPTADDSDHSPPHPSHTPGEGTPRRTQSSVGGDVSTAARSERWAWPPCAQRTEHAARLSCWEWPPGPWV